MGRLSESGARQVPHTPGGTIAARTRFGGPLFIVGMPRSGTKLLRELLNRSPHVGIPAAESHCLPYLVRKHANPAHWSEPRCLERFYADFTATTFFRVMKENGQSVTLEQLRCRRYDGWEELFERIYRLYARGTKAPDFIWGDKTPGYQNHMPALKRAFPHARFLHIIRDPRDYCLSTYKAWGKSMERAAWRWQQSLSAAHSDGRALGDDYKEVRYEDLLDDPHNVLRHVCDYLERDYVEQMETLDGGKTENLGDTKGAAWIVRSNKNKFQKHLPADKVRRIEEIAYTQAAGAGYDLRYARGQRTLSRFALTRYMLYDGIMAALYHMRHKGVVRGLDYFIRYFRRKSWRVSQRFEAPSG